MKDTISELYDEADKDAIFRSSMKRGGAMHGFNVDKFLGKSPAKSGYGPEGYGKSKSPDKSLDGTFGGGGYGQPTSAGYGQQTKAAAAPLQATITPADTKAVSNL